MLFADMTTPVTAAGRARRLPRLAEPSDPVKDRRPAETSAGRNQLRTSRAGRRGSGSGSASNRHHRPKCTPKRVSMKRAEALRRATAIPSPKPPVPPNKLASRGKREFKLLVNTTSNPETAALKQRKLIEVKVIAYHTSRGVVGGYRGKTEGLIARGGLLRNGNFPAPIPTATMRSASHGLERRRSTSSSSYSESWAASAAPGKAGGEAYSNKTTMTLQMVGSHARGGVGGVDVASALFSRATQL